MKRKVPHPVDPKKREKPLPWVYPKSLNEDPDAHKRVKQIIKSPSYQADRVDGTF